MFKSEFLKSTFGAALLAVAPTLALQAQGGSSSTNAAVSAFEKLGDKMGLTGKSAKVFEYSAYTVVTAASVFLLYCIVRFVENKVALNILEKNGSKNKLYRWKEKAVFVGYELNKIKKKLESLEKPVNRLYDAIGKEPCVSIEIAEIKEKITEENEKIKKYVQLMKESGIYDDFEKYYFKLEYREDDTEFIKDLGEILHELEQALIDEGSKAGEKRCLEYEQVGRFLGIYDSSGYETDYDEVKAEIEKRVEKEKQINSEVYKAYLRFKLVDSFTDMLKLKKEKAEAEIELSEIANMDFAKDFKSLQDEVKKYRRVLMI